MPWVVVKFIETDEIEALPVCWLHHNKDKTWYPNYDTQRIKKSIKKEKKTTPDWKTFDVKLLSQKTFNDLKFASAKASKYCEDSEVTTETELPSKRVPKRTNKYGYESDSTDGNNNSDSSLEISSCEQLKQTDLLQTHNKELIIEGSAVKEANPSTSNKELEVENKQFKIETITFLNKISKRLNDIERQLDALNINVEKLLTIKTTTKSKIEEENKDIKDVIKMFPIDSENNLEILETKLKNSSVFGEMVHFFEQIGGKDFRECIRRFLKRSVTDNLAAQYSLYGHKKKKVFSSLQLFSVIIDAVQTCNSNTSKKEIEIVAGQWLAKAPERVRKYTVVPQGEDHQENVVL